MPTDKGAQVCHICGKRNDEPGELWCSGAHPLDPAQLAEYLDELQESDDA